MDWENFQKQAISLRLPKNVLVDLQQYSLIPLLRNGFDQSTAEALIFLAKQGKLADLKGHYDKEACQALVTLIKRGITAVPQQTQQPIVYVVQQHSEINDEDDGPPGWVWVTAFLIILIALGCVILAGSPQVLQEIASFITAFKY